MWRGGIALRLVIAARYRYQWQRVGGRGLSGGGVEVSLTGALRLAAVAVVSRRGYSALVWRIACGWFFCGTFPAEATWIGAPLIGASGLFIAWREHRLHIERQKDITA